VKRNSRGDARPVARKTLVDLEGPAWADPDYSSGMVQRIRALGAVPIGEFSSGDLRLVISQQRGLGYLVPLALDRLENDPLVEGELYPGDLLMALESVPGRMWAEHPEWRERLRAILDQAQSRLRMIPDYDPWSTDWTQHESPNSLDRDSLLPRLSGLSDRLNSAPHGEPAAGSNATGG
jgi:hypothetical protein